MDALELATELKSLLNSRKYAGNASNPKTFGAVYVVPSLDDQSNWISAVMPVALILMGSAEADPEMPDIVTQRVTVRLIQRSETTESGESIVMGANAQANSSAGRGLLELARELTSVMTLLSRTNGVTIQQVFSRSIQQVLTQSRRYGYKDFAYDAEIGTFEGDS